MVKFQCFVTDSFIAPGSSFLPIFRENELSLSDFRQVRDHADKAGITMTAGDLDGLAMIVDLDLPVIKVGSANITRLCSRPSPRRASRSTCRRALRRSRIRARWTS